ncbi:MAG: sulfatase [bacterium]|nr:sulfatase [bacterium]
MIRFTLTLSLPLLACVGSPAAQAAAQQRATNVVFLLVDDWGWRDAGCFGSDLYETPNIDRLAAGGMKFTSAYAACTVCSPTRAAAMTGMYPARTRVTDWIPGHGREDAPLAPPDWTQRLELHHTTIAEALRGAGYRTAHIGKWHLTPRSTDPAVVEPYYPEHHGFEINVAGNQWGAPGSYHWPYSRKNRKTKQTAPGLGARLANFPTGGEEGDYLTDTLTDHALRVIGDFEDEPFFLYLPYYAVHTPIQGRRDLTQRYEELLKKDSERQHKNAGYAALVTAVDESVGRIMLALEQSGIADDTAIILTGDNGGLSRVTDNAPLRAGKGSAYEGGVRVPCIVRAPGVTQPGTTSDEPVITVDFYPTILAWTGAKGSVVHNAAVDGVDLTPLMRDPDEQLQREAIYWHYPHYHPGGAEPYSAIRMRDWKLIEFQQDGRMELYDLSQDIAESTDIAAKNPERAKKLRDHLHGWRAGIRAQPAVFNE